MIQDAVSETTTAERDRPYPDKESEGLFETKTESNEQIPSGSYSGPTSAKRSRRSTFAQKLLPPFSSHKSPTLEQSNASSSRLNVASMPTAITLDEEDSPSLMNSGSTAQSRSSYLLRKRAQESVGGPSNLSGGTSVDEMGRILELGIPRSMRESSNLPPDTTVRVFPRFPITTLIEADLTGAQTRPQTLFQVFSPLT